MPAIPTPSKPVLYNGTITGMPNKTHEGFYFFRYNAQEKNKLQWYKTNSKSCLKPPPNTKTNQKITTEISKPLTNQPVLSQTSLQENMEQ